MVLILKELASVKPIFVVLCSEELISVSLIFRRPTLPRFFTRSIPTRMALSMQFQVELTSVEQISIRLTSQKPASGELTLADQSLLRLTSAEMSEGLI